MSDRIERLARRVLRPETYALVVAPAIADLHFEEGHGRLARVRSYVGVARALVGAVAWDAARDGGHAWAALRTRGAWWPATCTFVAAFAAAMTPFALSVDQHEGPIWLLALLLAPSAIPLALLPSLAIAVRGAWPRVPRMRGFLLVGAVAAVILFLAIDQGVTRANRMFREVEFHARGAGDPWRGVREMTTLELLRAQETIEPARVVLDRGGTRLVQTVHIRHVPLREAHSRMSLAVACIAYVLFGIAVSRLPIVASSLVLALVVIGHVALLAPALLISSRLPALTAPAAWIPTTTLLVVAAVAVRFGRITSSASA